MKLSEKLKARVAKRELFKSIDIEDDIIPKIELLEVELNDYQKGADELLEIHDKLEKEHLETLKRLKEAELEVSALHKTIQSPSCTKEEADLK